MSPWITLITSLPTENATARQRVWRSLKSSGAAVLRDGVYLLPDWPAQRQTLQTLAHDIQASGGTALLLPVQEPEGAAFAQRFDRSTEYATLQEEAIAALEAMRTQELAVALKHTRRLRKAWLQLSETDFFPGPAQSRSDAAVRALEQACAQAQSGGEPKTAPTTLAPLYRTDYQGRLWATRARPWVDRLACAWLIQRHIDPGARFLWLADVAACPPEALGFDFDGATFSHAGAWVTFEVLCERFGLNDAALTPLRALVHSLDAGGAPVAEGDGVERVLHGLHRLHPTDDDALLQASHQVFDALYCAYTPTP